MTQRSEGAILAQNPEAEENRKPLHWIVGLGSLPLFGIVAAFGIAPDTQIDKVPVVTVIERLSLPQVEAPPAEAIEFWREERVQRGDTVGSLLARLQVEDPTAEATLRTAKSARALYQLVPGRPVEARTAEDGRLLEFRYLNSSGTEFIVHRDGDGFRISEQPAALETRVLMTSGEIQSSLFAATDAVGLPDSVAIQIADIFGAEIDFHRDLRKGDRFIVVYEGTYARGEPVRPGRVLAAEFVNNGKPYRAVWFQRPDGTGGYYAADGKSLRKAFLRSPLEFSRISSGYSGSRYHPVLKEWRAHRGVDYAAPMGTRVKATSDGVVEFIGRQGGYGNLIILRHAGRYSSAYGHLNGFANGLRRGSRVSQGEVIGYVGRTGLATGPHLHYEFRVDGEQRNPLTVAMPAAEPVPGHLRPAFATVATDMSARLTLLAGTHLARID